MHWYLQNLKPGTRFRLAGMPEITGMLVRCSDCSATVRVDGGVVDVEFESADGATRRFRASRATTTTWAPATLVEPIDDGPQVEEPEMAKKKTPAKAAAKSKPKSAAEKAAPSASHARTLERPRSQLDLDETKQLEAARAKKAKAKPATDEKAKKLSAIAAAAQVLAVSKEPMNTKQMIEAMAAKGYWTSPGGKTPHATLYSAILREIGTKGNEARFKKVERGKFTLT
jgi:chemotaxis protein histidine kinase CheA